MMFLDCIKNSTGGILSELEGKRRRYNFNTQSGQGEKEPEASEKETENRRRCFGQRHVVAILGFLNCCFVNVNRTVVSITIVAMVKHEYAQPNETSHRNASIQSCPYPPVSSKPSLGLTHQGEFDWDSKMQGYMLAACFGGYIFTQIPGGSLADAIGSKPLLVAFNAAIGFLTLVSPFAAWWNAYAMITALFLRSALQGFVITSMYRMMTNWFPKSERGFLCTLVVSGFGVGAVVSGIISGWLCDVPHLGWPSAYYLFGLASMCLAVAFALLLHEHPHLHPNITEEELKRITEEQEVDLSKKRPPTPWKKMLTSPTCYAYFFGLFGHYWSISYFLSVHPTFMGTVLHFSMTKNGASSCGPVLMKSIGGVVASFLSNWLTKKNHISVDKLRKGFTLFGALGFASCLTGMGVAGCNAALGILFFCVSLFTSGLALSGVMISGMDMAPVHAGSLMGIACTIAGLSTAIIPVLTGFLTTHESLSEWKRVFWISSSIVGLSGVVYAVFGSAEVQPWNFPDGRLPQKEQEADEKQKTENQH